MDDGRLIELYRRFLGDPAEKSDVYLGFSLFFGGLTVGVIGLVGFLSSGYFGPETSMFWQLREIAIGLAFVGLPSFILSIVVLLPTTDRVRYASLGGSGICLLAIAIFVWSYPQAWNVPGRDFSPLGVSVYSVGLSILVASSGAALVAHHIDRIQNPEGLEEEGGDESSQESIAESEVKADIESAVADSDLSWGGVEKPKTRRLELTTESEGTLTSDDIAGGSPINAKTSRDGVESAVTELRKLQGWNPPKATGEGTDSQTVVLHELRKQSESESDSGGRIKDLLGWFGRG